jgi:hypothetical protein
VYMCIYAFVFIHKYIQTRRCLAWRAIYCDNICYTHNQHIRISIDQSIYLSIYTSIYPCMRSLTHPAAWLGPSQPSLGKEPRPRTDTPQEIPRRQDRQARWEPKNHMHVYACICMYMHVYACICMYMHVYACICMYMQIYVHMYAVYA